MKVSTTTRVVAIQQGPTPYYTPIFNALAQRGVDLHVVYMGRGSAPGSRSVGWTDFEDQWGERPAFEYSFHRSLPIRLGRLDFQTRIALGVSRILHRLNPRVILVHSWGPLMIEPLIWARITRRRSVMWTESNAGTGLLRDPMSMLIRRRLVALADSFLATGRLAAEFVIDLGADPSRVVHSQLPSRLGQSIAAARRREARVHDDGTKFLFVGRFVELKRPIQLAKAFAHSHLCSDGASLTFVGDGPLRRSLEEFGAHHDGIRVAPRAEGELLLRHYLDADVLVLPSVREVWGLVVNEALAAGLYVVATNQVGSAVELVDELSGTIVEPDDPRALVQALRHAAERGHSEEDRQYRANRVADCTPARFAGDLERAIATAIGES